jgi:hypothetical protein
MYKQLWLVEGTGHTEAFSRPHAEYVRRLADFFSGIRGNGRAAQFSKQWCQDVFTRDVDGIPRVVGSVRYLMPFDNSTFLVGVFPIVA